MSSRRKLFVFFFLVNSHSLAIPRWQSAIFRSLGAIIRVTLPTANSVCTWGCKQRQVGQEKTKPRCVYDFNETQLKVCVIKAQGITNLGVRCTGASEHNSGGGRRIQFFFFSSPGANEPNPSRPSSLDLKTWKKTHVCTHAISMRCVQLTLNCHTRIGFYYFPAPLFSLHLEERKMFFFFPLLAFDLRK